jgi:hypothetical protein
MHVRQVRDLKLATLDPTATCAAKALLELSPNCCLAQNRCYVPEWLLKEWSITVDPTFSDAA